MKIRREGCVMSGYLLGLDLGTNSIGWCLLNLDTNGKPCKIFRTGVRIFTSGRDAKTYSSLKATRREKRSHRRRRDRLLQRQQYLIATLVEIGLMPSDEQKRQALAFQNPYQLRKNALDHELDPHQIGRALFHLNQRRGFKSNRIAQGTNETSIVKNSIDKLKKQLKLEKVRTLGEFLANKNEKRQEVRTRRYGTTKKDLYELYPERQMLEDEFDKIWKKQASFNAKLYTPANGEKIKKVIFMQRKLKPQEVGKCLLAPNHERAAKALPLFQQFRIYQELANLCWLDETGHAHLVLENPKMRDILAKMLENKEKVTFVAMRKMLKKQGFIKYDVDFNLESETRKYLDGNKTAHIMRKIMGNNKWDEQTPQNQNDLVEILLDDQLEDDEASKQLQELFGIDDSKMIEQLLNVSFVKGYGSLSRYAMEKIMPLMVEQNLDYSNAVEKAGFQNHDQYRKGIELADRLDYYAKALPGHVLNASNDTNDHDEARYGIIPNPTVHIALNQLRALVNELTRLHGKPDKITLEIARDLPQGKIARDMIVKKQADNQKTNARIGQELQELGISSSRANRQKYQLWEELSPDPTQRRCVFTGEMIARADIFLPRIEVEHILPRSITLDDSMANKTLCTTQANRFKNNRSPYEAFANSPEGYVWQDIVHRAKNLPKAKNRRFQSDAMEQFRDENNFLDRQLNDTRYISRYVGQYLATFVRANDIQVVVGRLTSLLRHRWGLNGIYDDEVNTQSDQAITKQKSRNDHRHHAVDALVVGLTSKSMLAKVAQLARADKDYKKRFINDLPLPWVGFREELKQHLCNMVVSHRGRKKHQGGLHNDTAYGFVDKHQLQKENHIAGNVASAVVHRVEVDSFKSVADIKKIRDLFIKNSLLQAIKDAPTNDAKNVVASWCSKHNIKKLRIIEEIKTIPIKDKQGNIYKALKGDSNAYMDVYQNPDTQKWESEIVSTFNANQNGFVAGWRKRYPRAKKCMRLYKNDMLVLHDKKLSDNIYYIQKMSTETLYLVPHTQANADARARSNDPFKYKTISASGLQKAGAQKLHVSPSGLVMHG